MNTNCSFGKVRLALREMDGNSLIDPQLEDFPAMTGNYHHPMTHA